MVTYVPIFEVELLGDEEILKKFEELSEFHKSGRLEEAWERVIELVADAARDLAPEWERTLLSSIEEGEILIDGENVEGEVYTDSPYAAAQERGTDPYFPNLDNIADWAEDHDMSPWALALAIAANGLPERQFMENALTENELEIVELIGQAIGQVLEERY